MKLKKDPKVERLSVYNLILRGSKLKLTSWFLSLFRVFGMVVYTGHDTKMMQNSGPRVNKASRLEKKINIFAFFMIVAILFLALISVIVLYSRVTQDSLVYSLDSDILRYVRFFSYIILYSPMMPITVYVTLDVLYIINSLLLVKRMKKYFPNETIKILDDTVLPNLGEISYAVVEGTNTFLINNYEIEGIYNGSKNYEIYVKKLLKDFKPETATLKISSINKESSSRNDQFDSQSKVEKFLPLAESINLSNRTPGRNADIKLEFALEEEEKKSLGDDFPEEDVDDISQKMNDKVFVLDKSQANRTAMDIPSQHNMTTTKPEDQGKEEFMNYSNKDFLKDLMLNDDQLVEFMKALTLCHHSKITFNTETNTYDYESERKEEEILLDYARSLNYIFEATDKALNPEEYRININRKKYYMKILSINEFSDNHNCFSILVQNKDGKENEATLYVKAPVEKIRNQLSLSQQEYINLDAANNSMKNKGLKCIAFAKKKISGKVLKEYLECYDSLKFSLVPQQANIDELNNQLEENLSLVGIVGLRIKINEHAVDTMKMFKETSTNIWLMSGNTKEQVLGLATGCEIISSVDEAYYIYEENNDNLVLKIRSILNDLKMFFSLNNNDPAESLANSTRIQRKISNLGKSNSQKGSALFGSIISIDDRISLSNFAIVINGKSLNIIMDDPYLFPHFAFITNLLSNVIIYDITPEMKGRLIDMMKNNFYGNPLIMGIGFGHNDSILMRKADIAIELMDSEPNAAKRNNCHMGDIQISSFAVLRKLLLYFGREINERLFNIIYFLFYKSMLLGLLLFLFNWYSNFTGTTLFNSLAIFLYTFLFSSINILIYGAFNKMRNRGLTEIYPALYIDGRLSLSKSVRIFLFVPFMAAVVEGITVFYTNVYIVHRTVHLQGFSADKSMFVISIFICIVIITNCKIFFICFYKRIWISWVFLPITVALLAIYITINDSSGWTLYYYGNAVQQIFQRYPTIMCLFWNISISLLFTLFKQIYLFPYFFTYLETKFSTDPFVTNEKILYFGTKEQKISYYIRSNFKTAEMDILVQEMLNPGEMSTEAGLNKLTLQMTSKLTEKKYKHHCRYSRKKSAKALLVFNFLYITAYFIEDIATKYAQQAFRNLAGMVILFIYILVVFYKPLDAKYFKVIVLITSIFVGLKIMQDYVFLSTIDVILGTVITIIVITSNIGIPFLIVVALTIIVYICYVVKISLIFANFAIINGSMFSPYRETIKDYLVFGTVLYIGTVTAFSLFLNYRYEKQKRNEYLTSIRNENQKKIGQDILSILVPNFVKDLLANDIQSTKALQEEQKNVCILFCDIYDFDTIISKEGTKIVEMLDNLFRAFDGMCETHGIQKIETVGKTYMAAAGIEACESNISPNLLSIKHTRRVVNMAFDMMKHVEKITYDQGRSKIIMKIGVHCGNCIAGVIGYHKPQFSLIGDTVNTTSRICATGEKGLITISEQAYNDIKGTELYFKKREVEAKGKGIIITYQTFMSAPESSKFKSVQNRLKKAVGKISEQSQLLAKHKSFGPSSLLKTLMLKSGETQEDKSKSTQFMITRIFNTKSTSKEKDSKKSKDEEKDNFRTIDTEIKSKSTKKLLGSNDSFDDSEEEEENINHDMESLKISRYLLLFDHSQANLLADYLTDIRNRNSEILILQGILIIVYLIMTFFLIPIRSIMASGSTILILRGIFLAFLISSMFFMHHICFLKKVKLFVALSYSFGALISVASNYSSTLRESFGYNLVEFSLIFYVFVSNIAFTFVELLIVSIITVCAAVILIAFSSGNYFEQGSFVFYLLVLLLFRTRKMIKAHVKYFNHLLYKNSKKIDQEALVSQLLPTHIFEKFKNTSLNNKLELTNEFEDVTLLFADIVGFTNYSASVTPAQVVTMLRNLFTDFDKCCLYFNVYKVYTIGDCYVVLGFVNAAKRNPVQEAINVVKMGLSMINIIRRGKIIGGVIGTELVRYDIYGKDVLIANKMESNGISGNICVSEATKAMLEKDSQLGFTFQKHKDVDVKDSKPIASYQIKESREQALEIE